MSMGTYLSVITLNVNGLNSSIRHRLAERIKTNKQKNTRTTYILHIRDSLQI